MKNRGRRERGKRKRNRREGSRERRKCDVREEESSKR